MSDPLLIEVERSGVIESVHLVDVAVVDASGSLIASAGDPGRPAAFRSSAKPIQARAAIEAGWRPSDDAALAIACASHNGEPAHVDAVRAVLRSAGLDEAALRCPLDAPMDPDAALAVTARARVYHNCSGKHAGMLAACVAAGWPLETYRDPDHPLQRMIADRVRALTGVAEMPILVDGCGAPTMVAPLRAFARAFGAIDGGDEARAMRAHPFLVAGTARVDTDVMTVIPGLLAKGGAEGMACVSTGTIAVALKSRDGAARARGPALLRVLDILDIADAEARDALAIHARPPVLGGGAPVGTLRVHGGIQRH